MLTPKLGRGRPRKFGRSARSISVTLPEDVIERLKASDADVGRAIVGLVDRAPKARRRQRPLAALASYGNHAVILVPPVAVLRRLRGVQLVPVGDGRSLIALDHAHAVPELELGLRDLIDSPLVKGADRDVLLSLAEILRQARQSHALSVAERSIIVLEKRRSRI